MEKLIKLLFPLPFVRPDNAVVNDALSLFFSYLVLHYDNSEINSMFCSEVALCEYITQLVIDEIEIKYQDTNGYLYTGVQQPITDLENCVFVNNDYFNATVKYVAHHMHNLIMPEISRQVSDLISQGHNVTKTKMEWTVDNPTTLGVNVMYH